MSSESLLPIHPSFQQERNLDLGALYFSDQFSDTAIRTIHLGAETDPGDVAQNLLEEVEELERIGINTIHPAPVITTNGLALVCDRLQGTNIDDEIRNGNKEATFEFGKTLAGVSTYYEKAAKQPARKSFMGDIASPNQFTWQEGRVILHDLSIPITNELGTNYANETLLMNVGFVATELARYHTEFDPAIVEEIYKTLESTVDVLAQRLPVDKRYILLTRLIFACRDNPRALQSIVEIYDADLFD